MTEQGTAPAFGPRGTSTRAVRTPKTAELVARSLRKMIVNGELKDGDRLPHEAELVEHFSVSRPTLREAVRVLEAERLVEVRRGSRSGARVCVPGTEIVARPASLLLELSGATVEDVFVAGEAIEPAAARLLALSGNEAAFDELEQIVDETIPTAYAGNDLGAAASYFHLRMVELSGNTTLAIVAGMLNDIFTRHTSNVTRERMAVESEDSAQNYRRLVRSMRRLIKLLRAGDGDGAFDHWREHMRNSRTLQLEGNESIPVRDILDD